MILFLVWENHVQANVIEQQRIELQAQLQTTSSAQHAQAACNQSLYQEKNKAVDEKVLGVHQ